MFKRTKIGAGVLVALGGTVAMTAPAFAQTQTVEVTGSRIKRVDSEGAQPVTVRNAPVTNLCKQIIDIAK